jgi:hypothetical protein
MERPDHKGSKGVAGYPLLCEPYPSAETDYARLDDVHSTARRHPAMLGEMGGASSLHCRMALGNAHSKHVLGELKLRKVAFEPETGGIRAAG